MLGKTGLACLLVVATFAVYSHVRQHEFVNYDDPNYLTENPHVHDGLTWSGIVWAFTSTDDGNWFPLTRLTHLIDWQLFGAWSGGHHLVSLAIHLLATLLLFAAWLRMTRATWPSFVVAAIFALHPLHVESVAWAAERKDVLSGLFWFATILAYAYYAEQPSARRYALVVGSFVLGLLSKSMIVTLPFVLLLLDLWPLGRLARAAPASARSDGRRKREAAEQRSRFRPGSIGALIREKGLLFALTAVACVVTFTTQQAGGAVISTDSIPVGLRVSNAIVSYVVYLWSAIWPAKLAVFYPHPISIPIWQVVGAAVVLAAITGLVIRARVQRPYLLVGWLWYLGTLVPVIGLVQVGAQSHADRYMYVPLVGLTVMAVWSVGELVARRPAARVPIVATATAACAALALACWLQVQHWQSSHTLFAHAVAVVPDNFVADNNLGEALREDGQIDEAIALYHDAIRVKPTYADAQNNLGEALMKRGDPAEAIAFLAEAIRLSPQDPDPYVNLGSALSKVGRIQESIAAYQGAIRLAPDSADARTGLAASLVAAGDEAGGLETGLAAARLDPNSGIAHYNAGRLLAQAGRLEESAAEYNQAIRLMPDFHEAHFNLGIVLASLQHMPEAIGEFRTAIRLKPDYAKAHSNLGSALALEGKLDEAIAEFTEALRLQPDLVEAKKNLDYARTLKSKK